MNKQELEQGLANFYGTENYYKYPLGSSLMYTDGVHFFLTNAGNGAFWFLDIIATELNEIRKTEEFLSIHLEVIGSAAHLYADDGNDNVLWSREIEWTDCPEGDWQFYLTNNVLLLTSEY